MGRLPRPTGDDLIYHAINRGNNRADVLGPDGERDMFLGDLARIKARYPFALFGYRISLESDRFRIFSAQAKGAFQCQEISPRVRFALEQSGESRRQVRDALGAGEAKDRHELGAGGLGMVLRQVGEGSAGWRAGATRGELAPVDPVPAAHRLDHQGEIQSSKQASLPSQVAMGLIAEAHGADDPGIAHCRGAIHAVPRPTGGQAG